MTNMVIDGDLDLKNISFCRLETQQECLYGTLYIPKLLDVSGMQYKIIFLINKNHIILVDNSDFSYRIINQIQTKKLHQGETIGRFIYNYFIQIMSRDIEMMGRYEHFIMSMEEKVMGGHIQSFQKQMFPIRKELLILREYYDEIMDVGKELENNENKYFMKKQLKYFGIVVDRADRLKEKTNHLLEYARQVNEAYQSRVDSLQNQNMQFLTVISTIFFPLTLITGWYGMNFQNMPELANGYPFVIILSIVVIVVCIMIFKKKNML